jgi:hypothetical protein
MTAPMIAAPIPLPVSFGTTTAAATPTAMWAAVLVALVGLMMTTSLLGLAAGPGCHPSPRSTDLRHPHISIPSLAAIWRIDTWPVSCNLHIVDVITEPGTINDMVGDAAAAGHAITTRLIRDWTEHGLLDKPQRRPAGKGRGSVPALYSANQRSLLLTLLHHRQQGNTISGLARIPVAIWMYWGEEWVPLRQARRSLMRFLGDPASRTYAQDARRASKERARAAAQAILGQLDNPVATSRARRELLATVTDAAYTGEPDLERLDRAYRDVFEPGAGTIRRATGHPSAPFTTDVMIALTEARLAAVNALTTGKVTDQALISARDAHLFAYAEYAAKQHLLAAAVPAGTGHLYEPVTAEDTLSNCCGHLLTAIGLEIMHPVTAEQLRRERAFQRRPTPAMVGLTAAQTRADG